ncbi:MAG: type IV secretion protein Rhs, partial [Firmicutes bacterium]|nr:type IV secretion protein Rhs [Bacillota bacterium]
MANELNQYEQRTVPGVKELAGTALTNATVTVNDLPTDRHGPWWRHAFEADNDTSAAYTQAVVTAVYSNLYSSATGNVFVAGTPEAFAYDHDGNLTQDGRFDYAWDAENRLASATTRDDLPAGVPRVRVTHRYDHQSRRIATERETWGGAAWQPAGTNRYLYDGWNVVAETRSAAPANTNLYVWGLDLSGSLQGAGGIGGLLTVRKRLEDGTGIVRNYDYLFDANGNVVQEILRTDG